MAGRSENDSTTLSSPRTRADHARVLRASCTTDRLHPPPELLKLVPVRHDAAMQEPMVLARIRLGERHRPTGRTKHYYGLPGGERHEVPVPVELRITKYEGDAGYYLFYCDESGQELTDTYHDSVADAMAQAEWEFGVRPDEWQTLGAPE